MLALHWPSGPWPLDAGLWTLVPSDAGRHRHWSLRRSSFSARDGARNLLDQPPIIQLLIRRIVQTTIKGSSMKFRSPRLSILVAALAMPVFPGANQEQIRVFKEYEGRRRGGNSVRTPTRIVRNNSRL